MRRVVVTGLGAVSPCGLTADQTWESVVAGRSGIGPITRFDASGYASRIAGECADFDPEQYIEKRKLREGDRFIHFAVAATQQAVEQAGFEPAEEERERVGTFIGVGMCGLELLERTARTLFEKGPRRITPYFIPACISNLAPGHVTMRWGFKGPSYTPTSACSSGAHAVGEAFRWIQRGDIDAAVAGGTEACITGLGVGGFAAMKALSTRNEQPTEASRPFDRERDGFVIAEGAGILLLEERERAVARGAPVLAELVGYGATSDAHHLTQPAPGAEGARRAMGHALRDAGIEASDVGYVNAHATSTPTGDAQEAEALRAVFGDHAGKGLWVSSTKSMTGHLLGAAGGLEAVLSVLVLDRGVVPPTTNLRDVDPACADLDLVPNEARERTLKATISNSFGFGGTNVSLVFQAHR
ncbi:MAG: beta-ketoacyl-ACP synthase II [Myxococcota bacterium]